MTQEIARCKQIFCLPKALPLACAITLFAVAPQVLAQESTKAAPAGSAAGTIIVPPASDPGMVRKAPPGGDPQAIKPPPMPVEPDAVRKAAPAKEVEKMKERAPKSQAPGNAVPDSAHGSGRQPSSMNGDCKGNAASCKQDSVR